MQYVLPMGKENKFVFGATYTGSVTMQTHQTELWQRFNSYNGNYQYVVDTVRYLADTVGKIKVPSKISIGVQWVQGRQWSVGAQFEQQDWSKYRNFENQDSLRKSWRIAVGGQFTPDAFSSHVFKRTIYKFGFNYGLDPIYLRGKQFNYYSFTGGASFPIPITAEGGRKMLMFFHLNFETGSHGSTTANLVNESFFRLNFGITVSGNWYDRRKFD